MNPVRAIALVVVAAALLATGCASGKRPMYDWGSYEASLYHYYKDPTKIDAYAEALADAVAKGQRDDRVPPGLYAEYGYVLMSLGRADEARTYFELEEKTWPESKHLMDIMLRNSSDHRTSDAGAAAGGPE